MPISGKSAVMAWNAAMLAGEGDVECGLTWSLDGGWRTYLRIGNKALTMLPRQMRKLGEQYAKHPEAPTEILELGNEMIACSDAAKSKNNRHEIPDGAVKMMPWKGSA